MKILLSAGLIATSVVSAVAFAPTAAPLASSISLRSAPLLKFQTRHSVTTLQCSLFGEKKALDRRNALQVLFSSAALLSWSAEVHAKPTKATAEETVAAWKKLKVANELLASTDSMTSKKDWDAIVALLGRDEFKEMESVLLILVNGPILNQDDKKTIGTRKRYGIAADVLFGIGGVQAAVASISDPQVQSCSSGVCSGKFVEADVEVPKSLKSLRASMNEILNICKAYKEFSS